MSCKMLPWVSFLVVAALLPLACTRPTLPEQTIWWRHSDDGPVDIDAVIAKYPELDGVIISAPEYMEELERERKKAEAAGIPLAREEFRLFPGSVLRLEVLGHPVFSREVIVGPDGTYDFPLIGVLELEGRTLAEVRAELVEKLRRYIKDPKVSLNLSYIGGAGTVVSPRYAAGWVKVLGQLSEGVIPVTGRETISDIIALAGGLDEDAAWRDVRVIKHSPGRKRPRIVIVDWFDFVKFGNLAQDIPVGDKDIVYVPPHFSLGTHIQRDWDLVMKYVTGAREYDHLVQYFERRLRGKIRPYRDLND